MRKNRVINAWAIMNEELGSIRCYGVKNGVYTLAITFKKSELHLMDNTVFPAKIRYVPVEIRILPSKAS